MLDNDIGALVQYYWNIKKIWCFVSISTPFFFTEPSDNLREILQNVAKPHGVTNMRKLGHLNNLIKVVLIYVMPIMATALIIEIYSVALQYCPPT